MSRVAVARLVSAPQEWTRRKLQVALVIAAVVAATVVAGGVWSVTSMVRSAPSAVPDRPPLDQGAPEDRLAGADLRAASIEDAQPGPLTTGSTGTITIPQPDALGTAQVQTGFPHTPAGALAQLIAIDRHAIESASVVTAQDVITGWAAASGPTPQNWSGVQAVADLLTSAGLPADGTDDLTIELRPAMAFVKGVVGDDFVVPCVDFVLAVTPMGGASTRAAVADCQRMVWLDGRWVIGPGSEPAPAPSIWPGTQASYEAGYQWIEVAP